MFYSAIDEVEKRQVNGSKFGLERTNELLRLLGDPQNNLKIIHVAGTNGKGSICEYMTCILTDAGKRVGTFTSPEVYSYSEKYKVCGADISYEKINAYLERVLIVAKSMHDQPTAFEIETAAAFYAFSEEGCEYAVIECGMGGLYDSTNAVEKKEIAIISSVSLEHVAFLGNTIEQICEQKAGIVKNCPAVISALQPKESKKFFDGRGYTFACDFENEVITEFGTTFTAYGEKYFIRMLGRAQIYNACVCLTACKILGIDGVAVRSGLARANLLGRIERIDGNRTYYLDGGHNPEGVLPLVDFVNRTDAIKPTLIYGCLSDKDVEGCARNLSKAFDDVVVIAPHSYRAMQVEKIKNAFEKCFKRVRAARSESEALEMASGRTVVVCGSFTLLKECKKWIEKRR